MLRFLETFAQISFLAILLRQKKDVVESHRSSPGSLSSSFPIMSGEFHDEFSSVFHFDAFSPVRHKREKRGKKRRLVTTFKNLKIHVHKREDLSIYSPFNHTFKQYMR